MDVFGIFIAVSFIGLIITLVVMNIIKRIKKAQGYKPYSEYYVAEKSKDLELASKMLSDEVLCKVITQIKETVPSHKTRVSLRKERQRKK